jgi:hypothetical protein
MGTVYTAIYRPCRGSVTFRWPGHDMRQSFESFTPGEIEVAYDDGSPARVTVPRAA